PVPRIWRRPRYEWRRGRTMRANTKPGREWPPLAYAIVPAPLVLLLVEVLRGAVHEVSVVREQTLRSELGQLQSRALQRAKGMEVLIEAHDATANPWSENRGEGWFMRYWSEIRPTEHGLYCAIVDESGQIVAHNNSSTIGRRLESNWYEERVSESSPDVVWTGKSALGG